MMCCLSELTNSSVAVLPWPDVHRRFDFNSITWIGGRFIEMKKKFYKRIADEITSGPAYGKKTSLDQSRRRRRGRLVFRQRRDAIRAKMRDRPQPGALELALFTDARLDMSKVPAE
jgi:hypothetical protein